MALLDKDQDEQFLTAEKWAVVMEKITNPPTVKINIPSVEIFDILSREIPTMRISDLESADSLEADVSTDAVTDETTLPLVPIPTAVVSKGLEAVDISGVEDAEKSSPGCEPWDDLNVF